MRGEGGVEAHLASILLTKAGGLSKKKKVCRIKGGDPFIYGRGGEEVQVLAANNVNYQIVPGLPL